MVKRSYFFETEEVQFDEYEYSCKFSKQHFWLAMQKAKGIELLCYRRLSTKHSGKYSFFIYKDIFNKAKSEVLRDLSPRFLGESAAGQFIKSVRSNIFYTTSTLSSAQHEHVPKSILSPQTFGQ